ncbi:uncharacterized protein LOC125060221 [Pieris napi]|uniref:uncharacterized protein LOC125060221 n=1 Tax=Pieris napi TaxID=78633 RepID=UPI001FB9467A|nr:uncharacterized protein LOC125060221 [Pieris napi]
MERNQHKTKNYYDRVMPRVNSISRSSLKSNPNITRHDTSSVRLGGKASISNLSSGVISELPTVLRDYIPENVKPKKIIHSTKPKRTLQSLDLKKSSLQIKNVKSAKNLHAQSSAPAILNLDEVDLSSSLSHVRQCYSSRSHTRLKELKEEIKEYGNIQKTKNFCGRLYQSCGVLLNEEGKVAADKAVQVEKIDESSPSQSFQEDVISTIPNWSRADHVTLKAAASADVRNGRHTNVNIIHNINI